MSARLEAQFAFLMEADRLRGIDRTTPILDCSRPENSAEHSWHLALYAAVLAPFAGPEVSIARVIRMLLLHDLVEIDAGDHPINEDHDWEAVARAEAKAADRLFSLLPADQGAELKALWQEFEADQTPDARFAKRLDTCQPIFQTMFGAAPLAEHIDVVRGNLNSGRAVVLEQAFPETYALARHLLGEAPEPAPNGLTARLPFLNEADALKSVTRATLIGSGTRRENSAEHSWHVMLYAWVLAEHAPFGVDADRAMGMLLLHDIVEIDAGDVPIHGAANIADIEAKEEAAAKRLFGLLPPAEGAAFEALWREFEAAESAEAVYAKSIDRVQPVLLNEITGGGSWIEYDVSLEQLDTRVGAKVLRGAPDVWHYVRARIKPWFDARAAAE